MRATPDLSIVVPTYGGERSIVELVQRIHAALDGEGRPFEVVIVNDDSPDQSWPILTQLASQYPTLRLIRLQRNVGQMAATVCGLAHARGRILVTMDDDLQHPPEEIPRLVSALEEHPDWDVAMGSWPRDEGWLRNLGSRIFGALQNRALPEGSHLQHTAFRALRRPVADAIVDHGTRNPVMTSLIIEVASSVHNVEIAHNRRLHGSSNFSLGRSVATTLDNFLAASTLPLRWISYFGFLSAAVAAFLGAFYVIRAAIGVQTPPGWASSFLSTAFFGGSILGSIGLIGRYLELILREVRQAPRWVVKELIPPLDD